MSVDGRFGSDGKRDNLVDSSKLRRAFFVSSVSFFIAGSATFFKISSFGIKRSSLCCETSDFEF